MSQNSIIQHWFSAFALSLIATISNASTKPQNSKLDYDIVAVGDVMLGRLVAKEIQSDRQSPWRKIQTQWPSSSLRFANLEAVVSDETLPCLPHPNLCLRTSPSNLRYLREAGFTHVSIANNHRADLGTAGILQTQIHLREQHITALDNNVQYVDAHGLRLALIALNLIPDALGMKDELPSIQLGQQLRSAKTLADKLIVSIHWGNEYQTWSSQQQRDAASWLVAQGADLILGHHPHVIQPAECVQGAAVWYSLGNHVFDQKYSATQSGAVAACRFERTRSGIQCDAFTSTRNTNSAMLEEIKVSNEQPALACHQEERQDTRAARQLFADYDTKTGMSLLYLAKAAQKQTVSQPLPLRAIFPVDLGLATPSWLMLLELESPFDQQKALRPHLYTLKNGRLQALWRGSALAYPILDIKIAKKNRDMMQKDEGGEDYFCVLHEAKSHLGQIEQGNKMPFTLAYHWTRFGLLADVSESRQQQCAQLFIPSKPQQTDKSST